MQKKIICGLIFLMLSAVPVHGDNAIEYFNLGVKSTITPTKIKYFTKALELNPNLAEAYQQRGMLYFFQEKYDHVIEDFQAYIRFGAPTAEAYRMLGMGYLKSGFYENAIDRFSRAIEMDSELVGAYANRAEAYRLIGKYEAAIRDSTIAVKMVEDRRTQSDAYRTRAKAFRKIGRNDLAAADINAAWDIDPRVPLWWRYFLKGVQPEEMRGVAPFLILIIVIVLIFGLKLKPPEKDDPD
jgi:tetratricopeptide (TPR) repeat protein